MRRTAFSAGLDRRASTMLLVHGAYPQLASVAGADNRALPAAA
ncbi:MAG TPA: hypothetical protein VGR77_02395 [Candidatus Dormibacteraeota bacterium]|nr:hypothetical protein [Candidatus Dormibacteraeota bacterium]